MNQPPNVRKPASARAQNWSLALTGLDGAEALTALATAALLARADARASLTAVAGSALLLADAQFDAAYLVTVLGEIPGQLAALMELRRVLKPGGRLVVGEFADRHHVPLATLVRLANDAGLHLRRRTGAPLAYYALLTPCTWPRFTGTTTAGH